MSADSGKAGYTRDSFRLAVDAMCEEWDEWAVENQGTRECFEACLRKALAQINPDPVRAALEDRVTALVEALTNVKSSLCVDDFGEWYLSKEFDSDKLDAAIKAAGEGL